MKRIDEAIIFAVEVHRGKARKGKNIPYILHPTEAAAIVAGMTDDPEIIIATLLHDTVEDANISLKAIEAKFGRRVAALVAAVTEDKRSSSPAEETWQIRKQETIDALNTEKDTAVKMVVVGDKLSNMRSIYRDHLSLGAKLWDLFNEKDPNMQAWYYRSVLEATAELSEYPAWQEYKSLVEKVFP